MRAIGIILAGGNNSKMGELSAKRAVAAMPVTGSYRAIDFTLSNMTNSHIQKVAVFTQCKINTSVAAGNWHGSDCPFLREFSHAVVITTC